MMNFKLKINFLGYWFSGTGHEAGAYADSVTLKDEYGLPYLPGRSIKGIFREAFLRADENDWFSDKEDFVNKLFGIEGSYYRADKKGTNVVGLVRDDLTTQGCLHFSNATLASDVMDYVLANSDIKKNFYTTVHSTTITELGVAKEGSLRSYEVCIPVTLFSEINLDNEFISYQDMLKILQNVGTLITELGGKRRRGFGRCEVEVLSEN